MLLNLLVCMHLQEIAAEIAEPLSVYCTTNLHALAGVVPFSGVETISHHAFTPVHKAYGTSIVTNNH